MKYIILPLFLHTQGVKMPTRWVRMPPDIADTLGETPMRAAVDQHAGSIVNATVIYSLERKKRMHRQGPIGEALMPLLVSCIYDCLRKRENVPQHAARVNVVQLAEVSHTAGQHLAELGYLTEGESLQVATGMYGLVTAIMGNNIQAVRVAGLWLQRYLENVLVPYSPSR